MCTHVLLRHESERIVDRAAAHSLLL
eukprot:COSAG05_NODE_21894_length_268_cov_0.923077_1_plen_25_part_10